MFWPVISLIYFDQTKRSHFDFYLRWWLAPSLVVESILEFKIFLRLLQREPTGRNTTENWWWLWVRIASGIVLLEKAKSCFCKTCSAMADEDITTVVTCPILRLNIGPYFWASLASDLWGWSPRTLCKFPINGRGIGPGGSFLLRLVLIIASQWMQWSKVQESSNPPIIARKSIVNELINSEYVFVRLTLVVLCSGLYRVNIWCHHSTNNLFKFFL